MPRSCGCAGGVHLFCTKQTGGGLMGARAGGSVSGMAGLMDTGRQKDARPDLPAGLSLGKMRAPTRAALPFRWSRSRSIVDY